MSTAPFDHIVKVNGLIVYDGHTVLDGAPAAIILTCCCCGKWVRGRQWWNRDTGFGICYSCAMTSLVRDGASELFQNAGVQGYHWGLKPRSRDQ